MSGQSGKGNSSAQTQQTAQNEQVGVSGGGIGIGANSQGNSVNISSDDPAIAKTLADQAGQVASIAGATNLAAISTVGNTAALSIEGANNLAGKFIDSASQTAAQNVGLLTSVSQELANTEQQSNATANAALQSAFSVGQAVAPQNDNYTVSSTIGTVGKYAAIAAVAIVVLIFFLKSNK